MLNFDTAAAYAIAERMLHSALWRGSIYYALTAQDREDLLQEAVTEMWRAAVVSDRTDAGWLAGAARKAIFRFTARIWFGRNSPRPGRTVPLEDYENGDERFTQPDSDEDRPGINEHVTQAVWSRLYGERSKQGARGEQATDRDVAILYLLTKGYSTAAIAVELDIPEVSIKTYRARLRTRLRAWADGAAIHSREWRVLTRQGAII